MSANLKIVSDVATFDVKLDVIHGTPRKVNGKEVLMDDGSPKCAYKDPTGTKRVEWADLDANTFQRLNKIGRYVDADGNIYDRTQVKAFFQVIDNGSEATGELIEANKNVKTEVFKISAFEPLDNYLNKYQMDSYYQVSPSPGLSKKDFAKQQAIESNTAEMLKLWQEMNSKGVIARGELNITSSGYLPSVGYLRAVDLGNGKWTFEMARFKESKPFSWSESVEFKPTPVSTPKATVKGKATAQIDEL